MDDRIVAYFFTGVFIIGVCANLVVIIVVGLDPQVRSKSSLLYAFNLAVADCTMLLFLPFNIYRTLHKDWIFGDVACWLNNSVSTLSIHQFTVRTRVLILLSADLKFSRMKN